MSRSEHAAPGNAEQPENVSRRLAELEEMLQGLGGELGTVRMGERRFVLNHDIRLVVGYRDGYWMHDYEPLDIHAYGQSVQESLEAFSMEFVALWDHLAHEEDSRLTEGARRMRDHLHEIVSAVEVTA